MDPPPEETTAEQTLEAARMLIEQHQRQRLQAFQSELDELCKRHGVELTTTPTHVIARIVSNG